MEVNVDFGLPTGVLMNQCLGMVRNDVAVVNMWLWGEGRTAKDEDLWRGPEVDMARATPCLFFQKETAIRTPTSRKIKSDGKVQSKS